MATESRDRVVERLAQIRVALDPPVQALVDAAAVPNPSAEMSVPELRVLMREQLDKTISASRLRLLKVATVHDYDVPVERAEITVRLYAPFGDGPHPAFIHLHGGGFIIGSIDWRFYDAKCREICDRVGCVVVSVEYRLAPEFKFPTAPEDCYAALLWTVENASSLQVDPDRIAVGGESAGGNLAAVVSMMARDRDGPPPILQLLEVPGVDHAEPRRFNSVHEFGRGYGLNPDAFDPIAAAYFSDATDAFHPYASPLRAADLSRLPPAHLMTAEFDPLRDSGEEYGRHLQAAGVPTTIRRHAGHVHGSSALYETWEPARIWFDEVIDVLGRAFSGAAA